MKFQVGDMVIRPALGLCKITGITRMQLDDKTVEMYELKSGEGAIVRVPRSQAEAGGFRYPVDEAGIDAVLAILATPAKQDEVLGYALDVRAALEHVRNRDVIELARLLRILFNKEKDVELDKRENEILTAAMNCLSEEIAHHRRTIKGKITAELKKTLATARKERRA